MNEVEANEIKIAKLDKVNQRRRGLTNFRRENGLCTVCGKRDDRVEQGHSRCLKCHEKASAKEALRKSCINLGKRRRNENFLNLVSSYWKEDF